jgi:hypothetical protein
MKNGMNIEFRRHGLPLISGTDSVVGGEKFRIAIGIGGFLHRNSTPEPTTCINNY